MADNKEEKTYKCNACSEMVVKSLYSSKQLKNKGKRKCKCCSKLSQEQPKGKAKNEFLNSEAKGKKIVTAVKASEVAKAQSLVKKGDDLTNPDTDKYDILIKWLASGGSKFPKLVMKYYTVDYRGVHAKARLAADEQILSVPLKLIMTSDKAKASKIGLRIKDSGCQLRSSHSWLACFLLQEREDPNSFFKPYLDIIPVHYRNMPIFFDEKELQWLKGSFTLQMIADRKVSLRMEYNNICDYVKEFKRFDVLEFFWARLAVITRIFGFEVKGIKTDGLVAMADMLNHKRPNETSWTFDQSMAPHGAFTITTTKKLLKGAQIFDSYGRKCNSRYFVNYGFSLDFNEDNQVLLVFGLADDQTKQIKAKLLGSHDRQFQIPFEHKEKITRKCMYYLRVAHANLDELLPLASNNKTLERVDPISLRNEAACIAEIGRVAQAQLMRFDTTLEEDNKMLKDKNSNITMNQRNCVVMRRGEKEVLHAYIDLAARIEEIKDFDLRQTKKYLAKHVNNSGRQPDLKWRMENFFKDIWLPLFTGEKKEIEEMNNSLGV